MLLAGKEAAQPRCVLPGAALGRLSRKLEARRDQQVLHRAGATRASWMAATYLTWDPPSAEEQDAELTYLGMKWAQISTLGVFTDLVRRRIFA